MNIECKQIKMKIIINVNNNKYTNNICEIKIKIHVNENENNGK